MNHEIHHPTTIDPDETLSLDEAHEGGHEHHTPLGTMTWVFVILLFLTALTVWTSNIHEIVIGHSVIEIGPTPHIIMAMVIAVIKATLVAAYFMHLKYDKPMNTVVVGATMFGVLLFIGLTLADLAARGSIDRQELAPIVVGGNKHLDADGNRVDGAGVTQAARENSPDAHHGEDHGDDHSGDDHSGDDHSGDDHASDDHADDH